MKIFAEKVLGTVGMLSAICPLSESEHNLPPLGSHNPRAKGPSNLTPAGRVHERSPLNPGHPVAPMGDTTTLGPTGPIKLKNLFPQPFYTTHGGAVPLRAQQAWPPHALASTRKISPARKKRIYAGRW